MHETKLFSVPAVGQVIDGTVADEKQNPLDDVWNAAVSRNLFGGLILQTGIDNAFDYKNINVPNLPGRIWYVQASIRY